MKYYPLIKNDPFTLVAKIFDEICQTPYTVYFARQDELMDYYGEMRSCLDPNVAVAIILNYDSSSDAQISSLINFLSILASGNNKEREKELREYMHKTYESYGGV